MANVLRVLSFETLQCSAVIPASNFGFIFFISISVSTIVVMEMESVMLFLSIIAHVNTSHVRWQVIGVLILLHSRLLRI